MDKEKYEKSEDKLDDGLISSLFGKLNMDWKSNNEHDQREIFGLIQNHHDHDRVQPAC